MLSVFEQHSPDGFQVATQELRLRHQERRTVPLRPSGADTALFWGEARAAAGYYRPSYNTDITP